MRDKKVAVLGAGSWGTALAMSLARSGHEVSLWGRNPEVMAEMEKAAKIGNIFPMQCSLTGFPARQTPGKRFQRRARRSTWCRLRLFEAVLKLQTDMSKAMCL